MTYNYETPGSGSDNQERKPLGPMDSLNLRLHVQHFAQHGLVEVGSTDGREMPICASIGHAALDVVYEADESENSVNQFLRGLVALPDGSQLGIVQVASKGDQDNWRLALTQVVNPDEHFKFKNLYGEDFVRSKLISVFARSFASTFKINGQVPNTYGMPEVWESEISFDPNQCEVYVGQNGTQLGRTSLVTAGKYQQMLDGSFGAAWSMMSADARDVLHNPAYSTQHHQSHNVA